MNRSRQIGDTESEGIWLGNIGSAYKTLGKYRKAIEYQKQALNISIKISHPINQGKHLGNIGNCYARLGENQKAIEYYEQAFRISSAKTAKVVGIR